jgi:hypothetical protein
MTWLTRLFKPEPKPVTWRMTCFGCGELFAGKGQVYSIEDMHCEACRFSRFPEGLVYMQVANEVDSVEAL